MIWSLFRKPQSITSAIARLNKTPSNDNRLALYRSLKQGALFLAAESLPASWSGGEPITLAEATQVTVLTSSAPNGGKALLAFTDHEEAQKRRKGVATFGLSTESVLNMVIAQGFEALVINPGGPWAGVPREDVQRILSGAW